MKMLSGIMVDVQAHVHKALFTQNDSYNNIWSWQTLYRTQCIEGKAHPITGNESPEGEYRYSYTLSLTSVIGGSGWPMPHPDHYTPVKRSGTHCAGGWVGSRAGLDGCRTSHPPLWFNSRIIQPLVSHYTDYIIPVHRRRSMQTQSAWFKLTSFELILLIRQCGIVSGNHITPSCFYKLMGVFQTTCTGWQLNSSC